jgi:hypothetical protein
MPLKKPQPPPATRKAFHRGLTAMIELGRAPKGLPSGGLPQRIYVLSLRAIAKGRGVERAKPMVWEFLVGGERKPAVLISIGDPPGKKRPRMTSLTRGPVAAAALEATRQVETLPRVRRHKYELRRLRISSLSIGAFWLKSLEKGKPDLAVPYHTIHEKLKQLQAYTMEEFLSVIRPIAKKRLAAEGALADKAKSGKRK